jgi:hypothetical protein
VERLANELILSVLPHREGVFVTTPKGIYRASPREKKWTPLSMPANVSPIGFLAKQPADSTLLYYYANKARYSELPAAKGKDFGLFRCSLGGGNWQPLTSKYDFGDLFVQEDGAIYALGESPEKLRDLLCINHVLMSTDAGKHWDDISHDFASGFGLTSIFPDPDHRGLICLNVWCRHGEFVLQADDKTYAWDGATKLGDWRRKHDPENCFFAAEYSTATENFEYRATLSNYFEYPFGDRVKVPAFEISAGGPRMFKQNERVVLPVRIAFRVVTGDVATLVDTQQAHIVWGLKRLLPDGTREVVGVATSAFGAPYTSPDGTHVIIPAREVVRPGAADLTIHRLANGQSYERSLDLSSMCDFSKPGKYRVQLVYGNGAVADREKGEWVGTFTGPVFEINVSP